jgi:nucleoside-diphosphate-sugar epimerase
MFPLFQFAKRGILPLVGRRSAAYTFVHVSDMVRAVDAALETNTHGDTMFVGHPRPATAREVLETLRALLSPRFGVVVPVPGLLARAACRVGDLATRLTGRPGLLNESRGRELFAEGFVCAVDRLRDHLGVTAHVDLRDGLESTAAWYKRERWL